MSNKYFNEWIAIVTLLYGIEIPSQNISNLIIILFMSIVVFIPYFYPQLIIINNSHFHFDDNIRGGGWVA